MQRLEVSGAVGPLYGSLGVKGLIILTFEDVACALQRPLKYPLKLRTFSEARITRLVA